MRYLVLLLAILSASCASHRDMSDKEAAAIVKHMKGLGL